MKTKLHITKGSTLEADLLAQLTRAQITLERA